MSLHRVEFTYNLPESSVMEMEIDNLLDQEDREAIALAEIKQIYEDVTDIEITKIKEI